MIHALRILAISALILCCMFLPFFPGRYDNLAVILSFMVQLFAFAGLLLVPVGISWFAFELYKKKNSLKVKGWFRSYHFAIAALITFILVSVIVSLGAITNDNVIFGLLFLIACGYMIWRAFLKLRQQSASYDIYFNRAPLYLIIIPIIVGSARYAFIGRAVEFSRKYAISRSQQLILDIEAYHKSNGHYPASLQALSNDYLPFVIGIEEYFYEPNGSAYNVYFRQLSDEMDVKEIVMYNKLDQHAFAAHAMDILEYTGEDLNLRRGDKRRYELPVPHWIYFKFD